MGHPDFWVRVPTNAIVRQSPGDLRQNLPVLPQEL